jgi:hypothetical protein
MKTTLCSLFFCVAALAQSSFPPFDPAEPLYSPKMFPKSSETPGAHLPPHDPSADSLDGYHKLGCHSGKYKGYYIWIREKNPNLVYCTSKYLVEDRYSKKNPAKEQ